MAHPTLWPRYTFFYPIGNTPAVCLTQDLPPEEHANILLLGCGDPRNIMFTIFAGEDTGRQELDFTCCDAEPAVLARNILLFTLLVDDSSSEALFRTWNIFYHLYLDQPSLATLILQSRKLAGMSTNIGAWKACQYASSLRMVNEQTLSELHRHWSLYVQTESFTPKQRKQLDVVFRSGMRSALNKSANHDVLSAYRSAGPLWKDALSVAGDLYRQFWTTGTTFVDKKDIQAATHVNPTFVYSVVGDRFAVHHGTDPVLPFHLAPIFADLESTPKKTPVKVIDVVRSVKDQFYAWSRAYVTAFGSIVIRFFSGDALSLCHTLHYCQAKEAAVACAYTGAWTNTLLHLDSEDYSSTPTRAPTSFNVIDTSNIADHVGLVNVLVATSLVLSRSPTSTLYTESFMTSDNPLVPLKERLLGDVLTIGLLLDIMPVTHLSYFSTSCYNMLHESLTLSAEYYERLPWKVPSSGDVHYRPGYHILAFDSEQLARLLYRTYLEMFSNEMMIDMVSGARLSAETVRRSNDIHYGGRAFVLLLRLVKRRAPSDWDQTMSQLFSLIEANMTLLVARGYYQDLCCQLHLFGVYSVPILRPDAEPTDISAIKGLFSGWSSPIPRLVCVALVVPRAKLKVLEDAEIGSPMLLCEVRGNGFLNVFSSFQACFGRLSRTSLPGCASIEEDPAGWSGSSSLIVSFWIPAWILSAARRATHVSLSVRSTLATTVLVPKLGHQQDLFATSINDSAHVHILKERPDFPEELDRTRQSLHSQAEEIDNTTSRGPVRVSLSRDCKTLALLTIKTSVFGDIRAALGNGAPVSVEQLSPCTVTITTGVYKETVTFPFPIDGDRVKLGIARKSAYTEVAAPAGLFPSAGYARYPFPVVRINKIVAPWNIHRLQLDRQPALATRNIGMLSWVQDLLKFGLADRERNNSAIGHADAMTEMKQTINTLFYKGLGLSGPKVCLFSLKDRSTGDDTYFIYISKFRLEIASPTVVADAYVLPVTLATARLASTVVHTGFTAIKVTSAELLLWKRLLPALAERCRDWPHKDDCAYIVRGCVPASLEWDTSPLCDCGRGKSVSGLDRRWKPVAHLVTRIALGPLFAVPYLESSSGTVDGGISAPFDIVTASTSTFSLSSATVASPASSSAAICAKCGGLGKPKLLLCSRCKRTSYCSKTCQKEDWKVHKVMCSRG